MDCTADELCEVCDAGGIVNVGLIAQELNARQTHPQPQESIIPMPVDQNDQPHVSWRGYKLLVSDAQLVLNILRRLHKEMAGRETECRWYHDDTEQTYSCQHITIPARDVTDRYWQQFNA